MNVLLINTYDYGGAGKAIYRLHQNLRARGHNAKLLVMQKTITDQDIVQGPNLGLITRATETIERRLHVRSTDPNFYFFNTCEKHTYIPTRRLRQHVSFEPDVIIANWISTFINARNLYELNKHTGAPIFWYLVDMAPLTGGCHYAWDCDGYRKSCGCCPALHSTNRRDISYHNFRQKLKYIKKTNLTVVPATKWLTGQANNSALFAGKRIVQIMLGIDSDLFRPLDKMTARAALDLPLDSKFLFFATYSVSEERKGGKYLSRTLKILSDILPIDLKERVFLITAGQNDSGIIADVPFAHKPLGIINDDALLALAYQAADVFVCPSIEDSGPMMINEAIMCGTPVVSFEMGAALDLVHTGQTGYRAKLKDSDDLARGIAQILGLSKDAYDTMSNNCRELALRSCHPSVQVKGFELLFYQLLLSGQPKK
jgi:glycosyltransferase involved in cell wall biosynthesis